MGSGWLSGASARRLLHKSDNAYRVQRAFRTENDLPSPRLRLLVRLHGGCDAILSRTRELLVVEVRAHLCQVFLDFVSHFLHYPWRCSLSSVQFLVVRGQVRRPISYELLRHVKLLPGNEMVEW